MKNFLIQESAFSATPTISKKNEKTVEFIAVLQEADKPNRNGRVYYKKVLEEALNAPYIQERIRTNSLYGEAGHPMDTSVQRQMTIDQRNIAFLIKEFWWDGNLLKGKIETADTVIGRDMKGLIEQGSRVAFSLRAQGNVHYDPTIKATVVQSPIQIATYDWVVNPSHDKAFLESILEETRTCLMGQKCNGKDQLILSEAVNLFEKGKLVQLNENKEVIVMDYAKNYHRKIKPLSEAYVYEEGDQLTEANKIATVVNKNETKKVVLEDFLLKDLRHRIARLTEEEFKETELDIEEVESEEEVEKKLDKIESELDESLGEEFEVEAEKVAEELGEVEAKIEEIQSEVSPEELENEIAAEEAEAAIEKFEGEEISEPKFAEEVKEVIVESEIRKNILDKFTSKVVSNINSLPNSESYVFEVESSDNINPNDSIEIYALIKPNLKQILPASKIFNNKEDSFDKEFNLIMRRWFEECWKKSNKSGKKYSLKWHNFESIVESEHKLEVSKPEEQQYEVEHEIAPSDAPEPKVEAKVKGEELVVQDHDHADEEGKQVRDALHEDEGPHQEDQMLDSHGELVDVEDEVLPEIEGDKVVVPDHDHADEEGKEVRDALHEEEHTPKATNADVISKPQVEVEAKGGETTYEELKKLKIVKSDISKGTESEDVESAKFGGEPTDERVKSSEVSEEEVTGESQDAEEIKEVVTESLKSLKIRRG
jgi:hypothetical protein